MKGSAFIKLTTENDSSYVDIFDVYGVSFMKDSYINLINTVKQKEYVKNSSRLQHGTQYLVSSDYSRMNENQTNVTILLEASNMADYVTKFENFSSKLRSGTICLKIPSWYRVLKLVCTAIQPKKKYNDKYATFAITFVEPNPNDRMVLTAQS